MRSSFVIKPKTRIDDYPCCTVIGNNIKHLFWNKINQFQWNPNKFNHFEKAFTVGSELGPCEVSELLLSWLFFNDEAKIQLPTLVSTF